MMVVSLSFAKAESNHEIPSPLEQRSESHPSSAASMEFAKNDMLIGLRDPFFWFLAPLFALVSVGITVVINYLCMIIVHAATTVYSVFDPRPRWESHERRRLANGPFSPSSPRRRIIVTSFLLLFVATIFPYQFAYMVACIVQLFTCIRALKYAKENVNMHLSWTLRAAIC
jgi:glycosylphosphatidylinositol deacylase